MRNSLLNSTVVLLISLLIIGEISASTSQELQLNKKVLNQAHHLDVDLLTIYRLISDKIKKEIQIPKQAKLIITPQNIEKYFKKPHCISPLNIEMVNNQIIERNNTFKISCKTKQTPYPWKIFLAVTVIVKYPVVTAASNLSINTRITQEHVTIDWVPEYKLKGNEFNFKKDIIGSKTQKSIRKGSIFQKKYVCLICKNDIVSFKLQSSNFYVKTNVKALNNANINQKIKVKNIHTKRIVNAMVTGKNEVTAKL